jgi:hypothetical protein
VPVGNPQRPEHLKVFKYFLARLPAVFQAVWDDDLLFKIGTYHRHDNTRTPTFFVGQRIPIGSIEVAGGTLWESNAWKRCKDYLSKASREPVEEHFRGRATARLDTVVRARLHGLDEFVILVEFQRPGSYKLLDGATRLAVLDLTGAKTCSVQVALRS